jgi:hypothetical protein
VHAWRLGSHTLAPSRTANYTLDDPLFTPTLSHIDALRPGIENESSRLEEESYPRLSISAIADRFLSDRPKLEEIVESYILHVHIDV